MADTLDKFLRTAKVLYQRIQNEMMGGKQGIDKLLFPNDDFDTSSNFTLDRLIKNPHGVAFRNRNEQSAVRPYEPGVGTIYEVPHASEKTPISETLRDSVVAGIESTGGFNSASAKLLIDIMKEHMVAHNITRWKYAIDTMRTGKFTPLGHGGNDIGLEIDFGQAAANDITYDFTATGANMSNALTEMYNQYVNQAGRLSNVVVLMGKRWLSQFSADDDIIEFMKANAANEILMQRLMPESLLNTQGVYVMANFRTGPIAAPLTVITFQPEGLFEPYLGATEVNFMPDNEAVMFSLDSPRFRVFRGVDAFDGNGSIIRTTGEIVIDSFSTKDPITELIRSQSRYAVIPADVNKIVRSTGNFEELS